MSPFPTEIYGHILAQLPPLRGSDSSVYTLLNCSETNSVLRYVSTSAALWGPHYQIRYRHSDERKEEERKSRFKSDWRALYFERRRLESQVLAMMKDVILGNVGSTVEERSEKEEEREHPVPWLQVVGRSIAQLGMDVYDVLDILHRTAPRRFMGAPEEAELAYENPASPWKSWATCLKGFVLRHDALSRWIRMKDHPEETTFESALAGLSAFYGVSYVEVGRAVFFADRT
jgi:F-box protein 21